MDTTTAHGANPAAANDDSTLSLLSAKERALMLEMDDRNRTATPLNRKHLESLQRELASLKAMTMRELQEKFRGVFGFEPRTHNRLYLTRKIAWRLQERAEGGLSERARRKIGAMASTVPIRHALPRPTSELGRDVRLPPAGTVVQRKYAGKEYRIIVGETDFEYEGKRYPTLSKIARLITGKQWNGFQFFGLTGTSSEAA